ncbi:MAG: PilN domain-containing protein [Rhodocyclaceae bacterium]|nr:PilN domain-containing protein [Rhodocyclaceae bacterium]
MRKVQLNSQTDSLNLFGLDLRRYWRAYRAGWNQAMRMPAFAWLAPDEPVRLLACDGSVSVRDGRFTERLSSRREARATAVEIPDELVLRTRSVLPLLDDGELERAVALRVQQLSPFDADDTVAGWRCEDAGDGRLAVDVALASRSQLVARLAARPGMGGRPADQELWVDAAAPIVLRGFGEAARARRTRRRAGLMAALIGLSVVLVGAIVGLPVWEKRRQADLAEASLARMQASARDEVAAKERLGRMTRLLAELSGSGRGARELMSVLGRITLAVPDEAMIRRLSIDDGEVQLTGLADDAAQLLQVLSRQPGFAAVKSPGAITRNARTGKEAFVIEFQLPGARP